MVFHEHLCSRAHAATCSYVIADTTAVHEPLLQHVDGTTDLPVADIEIRSMI